MKNAIITGSLRQETNSFSNVKTDKKDFHVYKDDSMLEHIAVTRYIREQGFEPIPTLVAYAAPSGKVTKEAYDEYANTILDRIERTKDPAGVWLYLHGAMNVESVGSGEGCLVAKVRDLVGPDVPIAVALDFHANNTERLIQNANIICGYRTAPHVDGEHTQMRAVEYLIRSIKTGVLPICTMKRPPLLLPGEMVTTGIEPMKSLIQECLNIEKSPGVWTASIFGCMPWTDAAHAGASVVVCGEKDHKNVSYQADRLAKMFWDARAKFRFEEETAQPDQAIDRAVKEAKRPVFISDSGDNVTGGASGDQAFFLKLLHEKKAKNVLVAGLTDAKAVEAVFDLPIFGTAHVRLGGSADPHSVSMDATVTKNRAGIMKARTGTPIRYAVLRVGHMDVIVTDRRCAFTTQKMIEETGVCVDAYHIVVVKLGYMFPDLRKISKRSIMALTPGNCLLDMRKFSFQKIRRPMYPIDTDFEWRP